MKRNIVLRQEKNNFSNLIVKNKIFKKNQLVVHIKYGIGKYIGLCTLNTNGIITEYCILMYAKQAKLYVPITSLNLISSYSSAILSEISLNTLGSKKWSSECNKIKKKIYDVAVQLIDNRSHRILRQGFSFKKNTLKYKNFCNQCSYIMTEDQKKSIQEIITDMMKPIPMDRLLCGDVGFGKTEIAMQATFIALDNKKQVAILVPTTLLAQQHYKTFKNRFYKYKFNINTYSRFTSKKEALLIKNNIKNGQINVLIGTHKILSKNLIWKNLGLLIIDEEHRFGVHHKELIKRLYINIDVLTLTATPIPRTLHMSSLGIRDLSIISTPPKNRSTIKTFVQNFSATVIRKVVLKEISRGGQIYYIYNKIQNIEEKKNYLSNLIPEVRIQISHGKMNRKDLYNIMCKFLNKSFDVLLCTTIIDTGIHISNVNTIIIENADKFGLSQLHQLRGRIGRSEKQAYAFFFTSNHVKINEKAEKRLNLIKSFTNLGSGFILSTHDSEIRGVGELLGKNQSGHIKTIGIELYKKLLKNAINAIIKSNDTKALSEIESNNKRVDIQLHISAILPENYIQNVNTRLIFYKKISCIKSYKELKNIKYEIYNLFGKLPEHAENLFLLTKIRILAYKIGIKKIKFYLTKICMIFYKKNILNINWLCNKIVSKPQDWKLLKDKLYYHQSFINHQDSLFWLKKFLHNIIKHS
ncbi:Transcription-repair-coupling factor [Buchnera aphidicola (Cinara cuneomaculata)]|uniref:Transcription-repair-coupling factor, partial n=1 Tax=Buchnera aphidicola (Cinara cuneomaculata) TaxID=1660040 RepID=A0A451CXS4_9GAMM|nr:transcription-repair coupling factor [Buchnera aphidicola]VFP78181.1 Transcription-repair-coupling factor [Buchnera aphidicola (Cinara cuneomaculata)]